MGAAPAAGRLRRPRAAGLLHRARRRRREVEPVEVHVYISGDWIVTVRRCATAARRPARLDRRATSATRTRSSTTCWTRWPTAGTRSSTQLDRRVDEVEGEVLERPRQEQLRAHLPPQAGGRRAAAPRRSRSASASCPAMEAIHDLPGLTRGSREWLRDVDAHLDSDRLRPAPPRRRPLRADGHVLQRQRQPPQPARDADRGRLDVLPRLDAGDRLLRPELQVPDRPHRLQGAPSSPTSSARCCCRR